MQLERSLRGASDIGNAERFVAYNEGEVFWTTTHGAFVWDGTRFVQSEELAKQRAIGVARSLYQTAGNQESREAREVYARHAKRSDSRNGVESMWALAKVMLIAEIERFDANPLALNCRNGALNLRNGRLYAHDPSFMMTKLCPVEYDPEAKAPIWKRFLRETFNENKRLIGFMQRLWGYSLTGLVQEQMWAFFYGTGANGKSTLLNTWLEMLGDYATQADSDLLLAKNGSSHPTGVADLWKRRLVVGNEIDQGRQWSEALIKSLTGGDRIKARKMHRDFFEFSPSAKIVVAANYKPRVKGTDYAFWRRVRLVPFEVVIPEKEQDRELSLKLREELPGILGWSVRGFQKWQERGLGEPIEIRQATAAYRDEEDVLGGFIGECVREMEGARLYGDELFTAFQMWARDNKERELSKRDFDRRLHDRGYETERGAKGRQRWVNLKLR